MGYNMTSCTCPVCGGRAEYDCLEERVFCQTCIQKERRLEATIGEDEARRIRARIEYEEHLRKKFRAEAK